MVNNLTIAQEMEIANRNHRQRIPKRNPPKIPSHIESRYDEALKGWRMYNTRLGEWISPSDEFGVVVFPTETNVKIWYLRQM